MTCQDLFERLDAYHAGALPVAESEALERHLLGCPECAADFRFRRTLRAQTESLPREIAPPRDLWPGVAGRLGGMQPGRRQRPWLRRAWLLAAAIALVALSSFVTARVLQQSPVRGIAGQSLASTETAYRQAADELARQLELHRNELGEPAYRVVLENLQIIDEAIAETQAALAADPRNTQVVALLWASYEKKIDLLERAASGSRS